MPVQKRKKPAYPVNLGKPLVRIRHSDLVRLDDSSIFKSKCPACPGGILLVGRDQKTLRLEAEDRCISCGQAVIYTDIDSLRKKDMVA